MAIQGRIVRQVMSRIAQSAHEWAGEGTYELQGPAGALVVGHDRSTADQLAVSVSVPLCLS
eukprot:3936139-Rhodomonas_salina.1